MSKRSTIQSTRRHVFIYDEDWEFLETTFGKFSEQKVGTSAAIRQIVHKYCENLRNKIQIKLNEHGSEK